MRFAVWVVALCAAMAAAKQIKIVNTTRETLPCMSTFHDKVTPFLFMDEILFLNFSHLALPPANESSKGYAVDFWWHRMHVIREPLNSTKGTPGRDRLLHDCMQTCLGMKDCASLAIVDSFNSGQYEGLTQCYYYSRPMNVAKRNIVKTMADANSRILWAYNLVCELEQRYWVADQRRDRKKDTEEKRRSRADKEEEKKTKEKEAKEKKKTEKQAKEKAAKEAKLAKQVKDKADKDAADKKRLENVAKKDEEGRKKAEATVTKRPS